MTLPMRGQNNMETADEAGDTGAPFAFALKPGKKAGKGDESLARIATSCASVREMPVSRSGVTTRSSARLVVMRRASVLSRD